MLVSYQKHHLLIGKDMKKCVKCETEFVARGPERCCSLKCKIFDGLQKQENGCWLYKKSSSGIYSKLRWNLKWYLAHRISYEAFVGIIPNKKLVCHSCDTPKCINPSHLFLGTQADNVRDAFEKNRKPVGEKNHFSRFTDGQIEEMRLLKSQGFTYLRLVKIFNCSMSTIVGVVKNHTRKEKNGLSS
jgi:hypothetical protein